MSTERALMHWGAGRSGRSERGLSRLLRPDPPSCKTRERRDDLALAGLDSKTAALYHDDPTRSSPGSRRGGLGFGLGPSMANLVELASNAVFIDLFLVKPSSS